MHIRVVRFTDVTQERVDAMKERIEGREGPPEGVSAIGIQFLHDADQGTMVVVQKFETLEDMQSSEAALSGMDSGDTPGTRESVDRCEVVVERNL